MHFLTIDQLLEKPFPEPTVVAIGNFDGMHLGHLDLVRQTAQLASKLDAKPIAVTFSPHPETFFGRIAEASLLFSDAQKAAQLTAAGIQVVVQVEVHKDFLNKTPEWFLEAVLQRALNARGVVVGENFRFGAQRRGTVSLLQAYLESRKIAVKLIPVTALGGQPVSSTRIRQALGEGHVELAGSLLGRPHRVWGTIVPGQKLARSLGFPTANLEDIPRAIPKDGVYAVRADVGASGQDFGLGQLRMSGVCNIGCRPTVGGGQRVVEVHVFDQSIDPLPDWYGSILAVDFVARLRDEEKFPSVEALTSQIASDVKQAKAILL